MSKITKNYIYLYVTTFLSKFITLFVLTPYLARNIGLEGIGVFSYAYNIVSWFILITDFGISTYANKRIAEARNNYEDTKNIFKQILLLQIILHIIGLFIYVILIFFQKQEYHFVLLIFSLYLLIESFNIGWFYCGHEDFKTVSISSFINLLFSFIFIMLFVHSFDDIYVYILIYVSGLLLDKIYLLIKLKNKRNFLYNTSNKENLFPHLKESFNFFIPQIAISVYTLIDQIMLGYFKNVSEVGLYAKAYSPIKMIVYIITLVSTVFFPKFSNLNKNNKHDSLTYYFNKLLDFILIISIPTCFGMIATASTFILWYLSPEFITSGNLIMLLSPTIIFMSIGSIFGTYLMSIDKINKYTLFLFIGAFVNFFINVFVISCMGCYGTTLSTIVSEFVVFICLFFAVKKTNVINISIRNILKYLVSSLIMFIVVKLLTFILPISIFSSLIEMIVGIIVYFSMLVILKRFSINETISFVKGLIKKSN